MAYARAELWRRAAETYRAATGRDYFGDLYALHDALGLAIPSGGATRAFAHLTPLRNREVVLFADPRQKGDEETGRQGDEAMQLAPALYAVLRRLIDEQGVRAFNMAIILPPLAPTAEDWRGVPIVARIGDRGNPLSDRSDVGAMELFASGCITADPFEVAAQLRGDERVSG
jgi:hypothetical protein